MKFQFLKLQVMLIVLAHSFFQTVQAALPENASGLVGDSGMSTASPLSFIGTLIQSSVGYIATGLAATVMIGVGWSIYSAFVEARQKGDWGKFAIVSIVGIGVGTAVVILALLGVEYAGEEAAPAVAAPPA